MTEREEDMASNADPAGLEDLTDRFTYLDDLRQSGQTNMYGAGQYLELFMGLDRREARTVLRQWMDTFGDGKSEPEERARSAIAKALSSPPGKGEEGHGSSVANSAGEGLRPFATEVQRKSEGGAS